MIALRWCKRCNSPYLETCSVCVRTDAAIAACNARCNDNAPPAPEPERDTPEHLMECGALHDPWKGWMR